MHASLQTLPSSTPHFWETPGASTSAVSPPKDHKPAVLSEQPPRPAVSVPTSSTKTSVIDPQLRGPGESSPRPHFLSSPAPPSAPRAAPYPPDMPATYPFPAAYTPYPPSARSPRSHAANAPYPVRSPKPDYAPGAALLYPQVATPSSPTAGPGVPCRLPPIMQVEKQQVTTTATQAASASRRRNEAHFICPVPGCGSTFTRRFNLRGHLRSHTEERPYVCEWPGCNKGFARQHDCKRHQALHSTKSTNNACQGCGKTFSRLDALNRHLRSEGGSECRHASGEPSTKPKKESTASPESHDGAGGASAAP